MAILYQEEQRLFTIHTIQSTYQMKVDRFGYLLHLYYGDRSEGSMEYLLTYADRGFQEIPMRPVRTGPIPWTPFRRNIRSLEPGITGARRYR